MRSRIRNVWALCLLCGGTGALPGAAGAQPVAKASFLAEGSFSLPTSGPGALERPLAIALSLAGMIHVADENGTVAVFDASGEFVRTYGAGSLRKVASVALDAEERAYVLDPEAKTVLVFDESGEVVYTIGSRGSGAGQLSDPVDVAVGPAGLVYVLDKGRDGVQVFSRDGTFVHDVLLPLDAKEPRALGVGPSGKIFVADKNIPGSIIQLPSLSEALSVVDEPAPDVGRLRLRGGNLSEPIAVVATPTGTIIAGDRDSGVLWSTDATDADPVGSDDRLYGGRGSGRGSFRRLVDIALAGSNQLVMLDRDERKVERILLVLEEERPLEAVEDYPVKFQGVTPNLDAGVLAAAPTGRGTVWYAFADAEGRNVRVVEAALTDRTGVFGNRIRVPGPVTGQSLHSFGQAVERVGDAALNDTLLVVTEPRKNRFHVFDLRTDQLIGSFGDNYSDDRRLRSPQGVALFPDGRIAVADRDNGRIAVFSSDVATLLGTYPLPKAVGVTISAAGRMFAWDEAGLVAGEFPLSGGAIRSLPASMAVGGVGALATDVVGNVYALRTESGRVAISDPGMERLLARVGGDDELEGGVRLTVDVDGNIYGTDLERAQSFVRRWGVEVPAMPAVATTWGVGFTALRWEAVPGSFITGYQIEGAESADGPWTVVGTAEEARIRIEEGEHGWFRVAARTLTGAVSQPSPATPALHQSASAAFEAGDWAEARRVGREALGLIESGAASADASVVAALAWQGFVAAHEARDFADVLAWQELLGDGVPRDQAFDHAFRLADAYQHAGDIGAATDRALEALQALGTADNSDAMERVQLLRRMIFDNGSELGRWTDVTAVGEDILEGSISAPDPAFVAQLVQANLKGGLADRALVLAESGLEGASSESARRTFGVLRFIAAAELEDFPLATEYAAAIGDSVPASLYVDFESTLARVRMRNDDLAGARSRLLAFLLDTEDDIRALADPGVTRTVLQVFGGLVESGDGEGGRRMLDSLVSAMPPDLAEARGELMRQADSVSVVADTRAQLGEGFGFVRDALFRDALRFFLEADGRTDLYLDQRLIVKEYLGAIYHSLGRVEEADDAYRGVYEVDPDFVLTDHVTHVEETYGLTIFTPEMLDHFRAVGPIM